MPIPHRSVALVAPAALLLAASTATAQWSQNDGVYDIARLGYTDAGHTHPVTGAAGSAVSATSQNGDVFGYSYRYNLPQMSGHWAQTAWMWRPSANRAAGGPTAPGVTTRVGFFDAEHTATNGYQSSQVRAAGAGGWCTGVSNRFAGASFSGGTAWVRSPDGAYTRIGLIEPDNGGDGVNAYTSSPIAMNAAGQVIGIAERPTDNSSSNRAAWYWSQQTGTVQMGYFGPEHTHVEGLQLTNLLTLTGSGYVIGWSAIFNGLGGSSGATAWVWHANTGINSLRLTGAEFTNAPGHHSSGVVAVNESGWVLGTSSMYSPGGSPFGPAAWIARPQAGGGYSVQRIGLLDEATAPGSRQQSTPWVLGADGWVGGDCAHISMASVTGLNAWVWRPEANDGAGGTEQVGLIDAAHTRSNNGGRESSVAFVGGGRAFGGSKRYNGTQEHGQSAWVWRPGFPSAPVGLLDARHVGNNGYRWHNPMMMDAAGNVVGMSIRANAANTNAGQSAWYYSAATGTITPLVFSVNPATQYAYTNPRCFTPDGAVVGTYVDVVANAEKVFIWRPTTGFADLGSRVDTGLAFNGWSRLDAVDASQPAASAVITGQGRFTTPTLGSAFALVRVPGCGRADVGSMGGSPGADVALDNNDFIAFIELFFTSDPRADVGRRGGLIGGDNAFDNNDFVVFIDRFFTGC